MENLEVAFNVLNDRSNIPVGYNKSFDRLVLDFCKTFEQKARQVKDRHKTPAPEWCISDGFVSRESVCTALTHSTLNDVPICACDIQNAYFQVPSSGNNMLFVVQSFYQRTWLNMQ